MIPKRAIKNHALLFLVLMAAYFLAFTLLYRSNFKLFKSEIFNRSKQNIRVIDLLSRLEANIDVLERAQVRYLNTHDLKWLVTLSEVGTSIEAQFAELEEYNKLIMPMWVAVSDFKSLSSIQELSQEIANVKQSDQSSERFQRLFYLTRLAQQTLISNEKMELESLANAGIDENVSLTFREKHDLQQQIIFDGLAVVQQHYNALFWGVAHEQNSEFNNRAQHYFYALLGTSVVLFFYGLFLFYQILAYLHAREGREDALLLLGARDFVTGLFNGQALPVLAGREMARAKRRKSDLGFILGRLEPYAEIQQDLESTAHDQLVLTLVNRLRRYVRPYDFLFRTRENEIFILLPEMSAPNLEKSLNRLQQRLKRRPLSLPVKDVVVACEFKMVHALVLAGSEDFMAQKESLEQKWEQQYAHKLSATEQAEADSAYTPKMREEIQNLSKHFDESLENDFGPNLASLPAENFADPNLELDIDAENSVTSEVAEPPLPDVILALNPDLATKAPV